MTTIDQLVAQIADVLRLERFRAKIQSHDPTRKGYVNVIVEVADGVAFQRSVRSGYITTQMQKGTAVFVGYDTDRELAIVDIDFQGQQASGLNPGANNPADRYFYGATTQDSIQTLQCHPLANDSMIVVVRPWFYLLDGVWYEWPAQQVDLTDYIPSSGNHVLVALWLKTDNTIEITNSTEQLLRDRLDITDVQECYDAASERVSAIRLWRLYAGMGGIKETDSWRDSRQILNLDQSLKVSEEGEGVVVRHVHELVFTAGSLIDLGTGRVFVDPVGSGSGGYDYDYDSYAFHSNMAYEIDALTAKTVPVPADELVMEDSEDSFRKKKVTIGNAVSAAHEVIQDMIATFLQAGANITLTYDDGANTLTIAVSGLTASTISDFSEAVDDRVNALLVEGTGIDLTYNDGSNTLTIAVSSITASQVSDFAEAVDDRINALMVAGTGISLTYDDTLNTFTIAVSGLTASNIGGFDESVDDRVGSLLVAGTGISLTYNDGANTLTIAVSGLTSSNITGFDESVDDRVAALLAAGVGISLSYDDAGNALTIKNQAYWRKPARVSTTTSISVSSAPSTIDGITPNTGDRILVVNQTAPTRSQNGLWIYQGAGNAMTRPTDYSAGSTTDAFTGIMVYVEDGTLQAGFVYELTTTAAITIDTTSTIWAQSKLVTTDGLQIFNNKTFNDGTTINNSGDDHDTIIKGSTDDNLLVADAGTDSVNVGTATPATPAKFQVASTTKGSIPAPAMTVSQRDAISSPVEGLCVYCTDTDELCWYDGQRWRVIENVGWSPYAFPLSFNPQGVFTTATQLTNQYASLAIPMVVPSHMLLESVSVRNVNTATQRTWGWNLYKQYVNNGNSGENTLNQVAASSGDETFTPSGASTTRTITAASAPVYLQAGVYWLVIQNRHASNAFSVGGDAASTQFAHNSSQTKDTGSSNGTTLDFVAATWTKVTAIIAASLNGRVFGQTTAF